jgi:alkylated DNA repair dioxygenase AlkB
VGYEVVPGWRAGDEWLLPALRQVLTWDGDRATGWLYLQDRPPVTAWPVPFAALGPQLLGDLAAEVGEQFTAACFQAYRNGTGCGWHHDRDWAAQAILSLGVTRTFALRRDGGEEHTFPLHHGDLLYMPPGFQDEWEHNVPTEKHVRGERCSLVFRSSL